jgi:copper chaperone NosL
MSETGMRNNNRFIGFLALLIAGCGSPEIRPVDIYPEDMCAHCRMAISDQSFASEIITGDRSVYKFDDIGCMEEFRRKASGLAVTATFVKDYDTKGWLPIDGATIVRTGVRTPMGSGKLAFADSAKGTLFAARHPATAAEEQGEIR